MTHDGLKYDPGEYAWLLGIQKLPEPASDASDRNAYREPIAPPPWQTVAKRWCRIQPLSGRELIRAQEVDSAVTHQINMRFYPALTTRHRLKLGQRVWEIEAVIDVDASQNEHEVRCMLVQLKPSEVV